MPTIDAMPSENQDDSELKNIIKSELMREHLQNDSISFNHPIINWLGEAEQKLETKKHDRSESGSDNASEEIIVVDDIENVANKDDRCSRLNDSNVIGTGKLHLPIEMRFQDESSWITDVCRDVQFRLQPEEITEGKTKLSHVLYSFTNEIFSFLFFVVGVVYPAAQTMLSVALRSFVEDLLRRSAAHSTTDKSSHIQGVCCDDVQRALIATKHFDFLTNKRFGVGKNISS